MLNIEEMKGVLQVWSVEFSVIEVFYSYISTRNIGNVTGGINFLLYSIFSLMSIATWSTVL